MEVNIGFTRITNGSVLSVDSHEMDNKDLIKDLINISIFTLNVTLIYRITHMLEHLIYKLKLQLKERFQFIN